MSLWHCAACSTRYAVGLPACPHCGSRDFTENGEPLPAKAFTCQNPACRAAYAVFLHTCPRCAGGHFELEDTMPKTTVNSGASNGADEPAPSPAAPVAAVAETPPAEEAPPRPRPRTRTRKGVEL